MGQRVAIYCRVSTEDQNCERQERELRALADRAGNEIVGVFTEKASGARNDRVERKKVFTSRGPRALPPPRAQWRYHRALAACEKGAGMNAQDGYVGVKIKELMFWPAGNRVLLKVLPGNLAPR